ncbi:MAG: Rpn family recombination-promoting nuclease/putative transposase, partial [Clostridiales bacterium]|nr:Rpn family recombination-promoting nuclease/putative transposase [Clostridiales bacterium]
MLQKFQDLTIKNSFMFAAVMSNEELCRHLLEVILEIRIRKVSIVTEKTINYHPEYHGIRLDVLAVEDGTERRFNVEMQVKRKDGLLRRCRYYHAHMDMDVLLTNMEYKNLPDCYVIFICDFDPLNSGLYRYTCQMTCRENGQILSDGSRTILLNTKGTNPEDIPKELVDFLTYARHPDQPSQNILQDDFVRSLDEEIAAIKRNRTWEAKYMRFMELLEDERAEARAEGHAEGHA